MDSRLTLLIDSDSIQQRIAELAEQIQSDLSETSGKPVLVVVLKGGFFFCADLLRAMTQTQHIMPVVFVMPRSTQSTEQCLSEEDRAILKGRDLIVADALLDSGSSIKRLLDILEKTDPASITLAVLLHKTVDNALELPIRYVGFEVPNIRLIGYGLDEKQQFRGLASIYAWRVSNETPSSASCPTNFEVSDVS